MYFYIDESGNTGLNLLDANQPRLYYGVLSSKHNLDEVAEPILVILRNMLGVDRLHASDLGNRELIKVIHIIRKLAFDYDVLFDFYTLEKSDYVIIQFFDQVFDQGINPAMSWSGYWTPLRYILLLKVAYLFDRDMIEEAWKARIEKNDELANKYLMNVCDKVLNNLSKISDSRSRELIGDSIKWAIANPSKINYNAYDRENRLQISPNLIGFQSVLHGIAYRLKQKNTKAKALIVDQQSQFNNAQKFIHDFYRKTGGKYPLGAGGMPEMDLTHIPDIPLAFTPGTKSAGLELVDIYLWIFKRSVEGKSIDSRLVALLDDQSNKSIFDDISLRSVEKRWGSFFDKELPQIEEFSDEDLKKGREFFKQDEARRKKFII